MKLISAIIFVLLISNVAFAAESDETLTKKLIGMWEDNVSDADLVIEGVSNYRQDGILKSKGKVYINNELVDKYAVTFKWQVKDGRSHLEVIQSSNTEAYPIGYKWSDKVISVDDKEFIYEKDSGEQYTMKRIK